MCSCNECASITTTAGEKGDNGSTTIITNSSTTVITVTNNNVYTIQRTTANSDDTYNGGAGYDWTVLTAPTLNTVNTIDIKGVLYIVGSDTGNYYSITLKKNGSTVALLGFKQAAGDVIAGSAYTTIPFAFEVTAAATGDVFKINVLNSSNVVTANLKSAFCESVIYQ